MALKYSADLLGRVEIEMIAASIQECTHNIAILFPLLYEVAAACKFNYNSPKTLRRPSQHQGHNLFNRESKRE